MLVNISKITCRYDIKYFKQINLYKTICMSHRCIDSKFGVDAIGKLNILRTKFIDTVKDEYIEGQCLTGKKLIVLGNLITKIYFHYGFHGSKVLYQDKSIYFSTSIMVPKEICKDQPIHIKYLIEDITVVKISSQKAIISATILLQFVDEHI